MTSCVHRRVGVWLALGAVLVVSWFTFLIILLVLDDFEHDPWYAQMAVVSTVVLVFSVLTFGACSAILRWAVGMKGGERDDA